MDFTSPDENFAKYWNLRVLWMLKNTEYLWYNMTLVAQNSKIRTDRYTQISSRVYAYRLPGLARNNLFFTSTSWAPLYIAKFMLHWEDIKYPSEHTMPKYLRNILYWLYFVHIKSIVQQNLWTPTSPCTSTLRRHTIHLKNPVTLVQHGPKTFACTQF